MDIRPGVVATWKHGNCRGRDIIAAVIPESAQVIFVTHPNSWGHGIWGPFPVECITETRELQDGDRWPYPGAPYKTWTPADLHRSIRNARAGRSYKYPLETALEDRLG